MRRLLAATMLLMLAACGGGGSGDSAKTPPVVKALDNFTTVTVDAGPAALAIAPDAYYADDVAYVSVTLCVPGKSTCQTIDHVQVDTGSVGLRILRAALTPALAQAFPAEEDASSNPVGECYGYVDGYAFGSVRQADFAIGGEKVANMPFQLIGDTDRFATVPSACSSGGGNQLDGVKSFAANGIIGIGATPTDCGSYCASGGYSAAIYYDCPASGCETIISRAATTVAPFQQLPNPVAAMATDNNGSILSLPAVGGGGAATLTGTLTFGIGTQTNNGLGSARPLTTSADGAGLLRVTYQGQTLDSSFLDSGSNAYFFTDSALAKCSDDNFTGFYCPSSPLTLSPVLEGQNGATANGDFTLYNAQDEFGTGNSAVPGVGADPTAIDSLDPYPASFDFGLPFFFGRKVFTAIQGRTAGGTAGPYVAF